MSKKKRKPKIVVDDESMASRMINAQLERAMGGGVEEDYLLDAMDFD